MSGLLDPALNAAPANPKHIHLIGICGTGMAAMAAMLLQKGFTVTGFGSERLSADVRFSR
jgi:UDP-N-acetylmuramate-alanine ligase